jgi:hypothetical protein
MKSRIWILFVALAGLCWGTYVPLVAQGGKELKNSYASFLCVGVAYFLIAVLFPVGIILVRGKWPKWTGAGITFATLAGVAGALGALCVILATVQFKGQRMFVAPVIFSTAPVINTVFSVLAALGAGLVLFSKEYAEWVEKAPAASQDTGYVWIVFVVLAGLCWGTYVPLIAQGGKELKNSYASFLCVGVAYFLLAVLIPVVLMMVGVSNWNWTSVENLSSGVTYATLSGVAGAIGALCVIFATFEFKGPKLFVAPLIFTCAPVINTLVSLFWHPGTEHVFGWPEHSPYWFFYLGIIAAGLGAGLVLFSKEYVEWKHAAQAKEEPPLSAPPAPEPTPAS